VTTAIITDNSTGGTFSGTTDALIDAGAPDANNNTNTTLSLRESATPRRGVLKFDGLSNITGPVTVSSATLSVYDTVGSTGPIEIYEILRAMSIVDVTWNKYDATNNWATAGGLGAGDVTSSPLVSSSFSGSIGYNDFTSAALATHVQNIINSSLTNNGVLFRKTDDTDGSVPIASDDGTDAQRPKLTVVYTSGGGGITIAWFRA